MNKSMRMIALSALVTLTFTCAMAAATHKPVLHGSHWVAITGKPLAATAGAKIFEKGGNAVDAACAMLAVVCTMHDELGWGGETQALIYDPRTKKVIGINALGVAPTGATPEFFRTKKLKYPPSEGPLAAVTPGNPGGLMVMLAEYGSLSLKEVLAPAIQMAGGYPIEAELVQKIIRYKNKLEQWPYSKRVFFPHSDRYQTAPEPGEIFCQPDLQGTLLKLVDAEQQALKEGKDRKTAIHAAYNRFYRGDIGEDFCRGSREQGGLHTVGDLASWRVEIEAPVQVSYKGIEIFKLSAWTQGPAMLQALNILENVDLQSMGYNSARYIHALYQAMNLAFADRDFYYGDIYFPPKEPLVGLLSKEYARTRLKEIDWKRNRLDIKPGDPYPFQGETNAFLHLLTNWFNARETKSSRNSTGVSSMSSSTIALSEPFSPQAQEAFFRGTTSIQAADESGWVISVTPSGGWLPVCIAGKTGMGMSQRMQSFVLDESENPFNVVAPGKRPRVTLTPTLAFKEGKPYLCFSVQGGDTQEQNLLQFFLNMVEFGMNVQEACEAANITSFQMRASFEQHEFAPGRLTLHQDVSPWVRHELTRMGYKLDFQARTSGPITAIFIDQAHNTFWGGASDHGEDYGIAW